MVKLAGDGELSAPSLLPENVPPQWQQKIAQMRRRIHPDTDAGQVLQAVSDGEERLKYNLSRMKDARQSM